MADKTYTNDQMQEARKLAQALVNVPNESRSMFALMVEAMIIGAEIAEKSTAPAQG